MKEFTKPGRTKVTGLFVWIYSKEKSVSAIDDNDYKAWPTSPNGEGTR